MQFTGPMAKLQQYQATMTLGRGDLRSLLECIRTRMCSNVILQLRPLFRAHSESPLLLLVGGTTTLRMRDGDSR
jgi:hypothetical protein